MAGPWRAFVREKSLATGQLADTKTLSALYSDLTAQEKAVYEKEGKLGSLARSAGAAQSFGLTTLQATRALARAEKRLAVLEHSPGDALLSKFQAVDVAVDRQVRNESNSVQDMYSAAKREVSGYQRMCRERKQDDQKRLGAWIARNTKTTRKMLSDAMPGVDSIARHVFQVPDPCFDVALVVEPDVEVIGELAKNIFKTTPTMSNLRELLAKDWEAKSMTLKHYDAPPLKVAPPAPRHGAVKPPCFFLQRCICCGPGDIAWKMRMQFVTAMKLVFKQRTVERSWLADSMIVAELVGFRDGPDELDDADVALAELLGEEFVKPKLEKTIYWHLGFQVLAPYMPSFLRMYGLRSLSPQL